MGVVLARRATAAALGALAESLGAAPRLLLFAGPGPVTPEEDAAFDAVTLLDAPLAAPEVDAGALVFGPAAPEPTLVISSGRPAWWRILGSDGRALLQGPAAGGGSGAFHLTLSKAVLAAGQPVRIGRLRLTFAASELLAGGA